MLSDQDTGFENKARVRKLPLQVFTAPDAQKPETEKQNKKETEASSGVSLLAFEVYASYIKSVARSFYSQLLLLWIPMRTKVPPVLSFCLFLMLFLIPFR